uniref:Uncharacterized protein n=1 Tax=Meloidogyne javanica TaxID=6303 RepID=A0A915NCP8_MELJA
MNSNGLLFVPSQTTPSGTEATSSHFGMSKQQKLGNQQISRSLFALEFLPQGEDEFSYCEDGDEDISDISCCFFNEKEGYTNIVETNIIQDIPQNMEEEHRLIEAGKFFRNEDRKCSNILWSFDSPPSASTCSTPGTPSSPQKLHQNNSFILAALNIKQHQLKEENEATNNIQFSPQIHKPTNKYQEKEVKVNKIIGINQQQSFGMHNGFPVLPCSPMASPTGGLTMGTPIFRNQSIKKENQECSSKQNNQFIQQKQKLGNIKKIFERKITIRRHFSSINCPSSKLNRQKTQNHHKLSWPLLKTDNSALNLERKSFAQKVFEMFKQAEWAAEAATTTLAGSVIPPLREFNLRAELFWLKSAMKESMHSMFRMQVIINN